MKRTLLTLFLAVFTITLSAQDVRTDEIQAAIDACVAMRDAAAVGDTAAVCHATELLDSCGTTSFTSLRCRDDSVTHLQGHLEFDKPVMRASRERGQSADGTIKTKTCFVKAGQSTKYTFGSKGHQELAVVAEAGGLVTMKIHVTNRDGLNKRYDDTKFVKQGLPHRKTSFELPDNRRNQVELEIINCGKKDCSFVVISN